MQTLIWNEASRRRPLPAGAQGLLVAFAGIGTVVALVFALQQLHEPLRAAAETALQHPASEARADRVECPGDGMRAQLCKVAYSGELLAVYEP